MIPFSIVAVASWAAASSVSFSTARSSSSVQAPASVSVISALRRSSPGLARFLPVDLVEEAEQHEGRVHRLLGRHGPGVDEQMTHRGL